MKNRKKLLGALFMNFIFAINAFCQDPQANCEPFEGHGVSNYDIIEQWKSAGATSYLACKNVARILDAESDLNLSTIGINSAESFILRLNDSLGNYKNEGYVVILFGAGIFQFDDIINLENQKNLIFKGLDSRKSKIHFVHSKTGININSSFNIGFEDLTLSRIGIGNDKKDHDKSGGFHVILTSLDIGTEVTNNCWFSGLFFENIWKAGINIVGGKQNTVTGCTFGAPQAIGGNGQGYGVALQTSQCFQNLICNNIFIAQRHAVLFQFDNPSYNVIAYNYFDFGKADGWGRPYNICFHGKYHGLPGPNKNLIEGNNIQTVGFDRTHGSNGYCNTFFRDFIWDFEIVDYCWLGFTCETYQDANGNKKEYDFIKADQHQQNAIGCKVYGTLDISGTKKYSGRDNWRIDNNKKSYFLSSSPEYMLGHDWPYRPWNRSSINGAESRFAGNPYFSYTTTDPEGWDKYCCGPFVAKYSFITNNQRVSENYYKGISKIIAGPCLINVRIPDGSSSFDKVVHLNAGNQIIFQPGFKTEIGASMEASIQDISCISNKPNMIYDFVQNEYSPEEIYYINMREEVYSNNLKSNGQPDSITKSLELEEKIQLDKLSIFISPNPFQNEFTIKLHLLDKSMVSTTLLNPLGQKIKSLFENAIMEKGYYEFPINLIGEANGVYSLMIKIDELIIVKKVIKL